MRDEDRSVCEAACVEQEDSERECAEDVEEVFELERKVQTIEQHGAKKALEGSVLHHVVQRQTAAATETGQRPGGSFQRLHCGRPVFELRRGLLGYHGQRVAGAGQVEGRQVPDVDEIRGERVFCEARQLQLGR